MKRVFILLIISFIGISFSYGTENIFLPTLEKDTTPPDAVFKLVEYMPHYSGCEDISGNTERRDCSNTKLMTYIGENVIYPELARRQGIEGTAVVRFVVEKDGSLSFTDESILKDPGAGCGEEALRVIKSMPDWVPGRLNGEKVRVQFTLPVKFKLTDEKEILKVPLSWNKVKLEGTRVADDVSNYTKAEWTLKEVQDFLSTKSLGLPIYLDFGEEKGGFSKYFIAVGKKGRKHLIESELKNKSAKKSLLKSLVVGESIYFYNWEYKMGFLEILIKE